MNRALQSNALKGLLYCGGSGGQVGGKLVVMGVGYPRGREPGEEENFATLCNILQKEIKAQRGGNHCGRGRNQECSVREVGSSDPLLPPPPLHCVIIAISRMCILTILVL